MDINDIATIISSLGFPAAIAVLLLRYIGTLNETHKQELDTLRTAIENNTIIITKLYEKFNTILDFKNDKKDGE